MPHGGPHYPEEWLEAGWTPPAPAFRPFASFAERLAATLDEYFKHSRTPISSAAMARASATPSPGFMQPAAMQRAGWGLQRPIAQAGPGGETWGFYLPWEGTVTGPRGFWTGDE